MAGKKRERERERKKTEAEEFSNIQKCTDGIVRCINLWSPFIGTCAVACGFLPIGEKSSKIRLELDNGDFTLCALNDTFPERSGKLCRVSSLRVLSLWRKLVFRVEPMFRLKILQETFYLLRFKRYILRIFIRFLRLQTNSLPLFSLASNYYRLV